MPEFLPSESDEVVFGKLEKAHEFEPPDQIEEPIMSKEDWKVVLQAEATEESFYDMSDDAANKAAHKKGLVVVYPKDNQITIDIDSDKAYIEYQQRLERLFDKDYEGDLVIDYIQEFESSSGFPNRHIYITFKGYIKFSPIERIQLQSVLGSDPIRELLDTKRLLTGVTDRPTRFFEKPEVTPSIK